MFPDGGISAVCQGTRLLGTQPSYVEFVAAESVCVGPTQVTVSTWGKKTSKETFLKRLLLRLEGTESILYYSPDCLGNAAYSSAI